eukprot:205243-Amphidinium_carterae.2
MAGTMPSACKRARKSWIVQVVRQVGEHDSFFHLSTAEHGVSASLPIPYNFFTKHVIMLCNSTVKGRLLV